MNRQPKITRREQQAFIRDEGTKWLHFAVRNCPCNGVNCPQCEGTRKYFDDPVPVWGALTNGMNSKKKEAQFPEQQISTYKMLVEPRYRITKGDRVTPFGIREFEMKDEVILVSDSALTYIPINPRGVEISFVGADGALVFKYGRDFTIERELYGRVKLFSKTIKWLIDTPEKQEKFSAHYMYIPDFEVENIPAARISQEQLLIQELPLRKITVSGNVKAKSYEQSKEALQGLRYTA